MHDQEHIDVVGALEGRHSRVSEVVVLHSPGVIVVFIGPAAETLLVLGGWIGL